MEKDFPTRLRMLNSIKERLVMESSVIESMIDLTRDWASGWVREMKKVSETLMH